MKMATEFYQNILDALSREGRLRTLHHSNDLNLLDCTSNDYLALGSDENLRKEFINEIVATESIPAFGSGSSRLLYSGKDYYAEFEKFLSDLYGKEVLLFNSGYHANVGILSALADTNSLIVSDQLVHASIIDGIRLSKASKKIFPHNDVDSLKKILREEAGKFDRVFVVVESVYSMDGDSAPLKEIVSFKAQFNNMILYVDEAHAFGILGKRGLGLCEHLNVIEDVDILIATLSKAAASMGAFAVISPVLKNYLVNHSRSLIFSTAIPPVNILWSKYMVKRILGMEESRKHLAYIGKEVSHFICNFTGEGAVHSSPIIPFMIGGNKRTLRASAIMKENGVLALPIRRPTVAPGTERLRISLNSAMTDSDIDRIKRGVLSVAEELSKKC